MNEMEKKGSWRHVFHDKNNVEQTVNRAHIEYKRTQNPLFLLYVIVILRIFMSTKLYSIQIQSSLFIAFILRFFVVVVVVIEYVTFVSPFLQSITYSTCVIHRLFLHSIFNQFFQFRTKICWTHIYSSCMNIV